MIFKKKKTVLEEQPLCYWEESSYMMAFKKVYDTAKEHKVNMRTAAYIVALGHLAEAMKYLRMY